MIDPAINQPPTVNQAGQIMMKKMGILAAFAFAFTTTAALAQDNAASTTNADAGANTREQNVDTARYLFGQLYKNCPDLISRIVTSGELAPVLRQRPIDNPTVCKCALSRLNQDTRFINYLYVPISRAQELVATDLVKAYSIGRLVSSVMGCLASDLDRSLEATPLQ